MVRAAASPIVNILGGGGLAPVIPADVWEELSLTELQVGLRREFARAVALPAEPLALLLVDLPAERARRSGRVRDAVRLCDSAIAARRATGSR